MKTLNLVQGSQEWHDARASTFNASEAPAMLGLSKYMTRNDLLKQKATGYKEEVGNAKQKLFDRGHEVEALARPIVEEFIGEELFPCSGQVEIDGMVLQASFDGLTMDETIGWENKLANAELLEVIGNGAFLPTHWPQLEHQLIVSDAEKIYFTATDGTKEGTKGIWYHSIPANREQILKGWKQFAKDLADYQHVEDRPAAVADPIESLPAVSVQVSGNIAIISNLEVFGSKLMGFIQSIKQNPETDLDFANCEAAVKTLEKAEQALKQAESSALAQTASVDEMCKLVAVYAEQARKTRLALSKLVTSRKESIRSELIQGGKDKIREHINTLNTRLGESLMVMPADVDFATAIKGKKTITSCRDAIDTALANAKITSNAYADRLQINLTSFKALTMGYEFLFSDKRDLIARDSDALSAIVNQRIGNHKQQEVAKLEAQREQIAAEERAKIERQQEAERKAAAASCIANEAPSIKPSVSSISDADATKILKQSGKNAAATLDRIAANILTADTPRPTDYEIIAAVASTFNVPTIQAIEWMQDVDLFAEHQRLERAA